MIKKNILFIAFMFIATAVSAEESVFTYNDHGKRDPFWILVNSGGAVLNYDTDYLIADLTLEGITMGANGDNVAIINGRVVKINDTIGQYIVSKVNKDSVTLTKGQETFELKL